MSACEAMVLKLEVEKKNLQEKIRTYLDLWALHKKQLEDDAAQAAKAGKEIGTSLAYKIAKLNVALNSEQHRTYLTECKLEDATAKIESLQEKVSYLESSLQKEKEKYHAANQRASTGAQGIAQEAQKNEEANQKIQQLQELLAAANETHKQEMDALREDYQKRVREGDARLQSLLQEVNEKGKQLNTAQQDMERLRGTLEEVSRTRDDHGQNLQEIIKQKALEIDRLSTSLSSKDCAIEGLTLEKAALHGQLELANKELQEGKEAANKDADAAEKAHKKSLQEMEKQWTAATKLVARKEDMLQILELQLEELQQENQLNKKADADNKRLLKDMEKKCTQTAGLVIEKDNSLAKVTAELDELRDDHERLKARCAELENREKDNKEEEVNKTKLKEMEIQYETAAKAVAKKDAKLKEVMQHLEAAHEENETLLSKCAELEGSLKHQLAKAQATYGERMKEMEEQYTVANTLVANLDKKIAKLTQKLGESEKTCAKMEARWMLQHSEAVEMHEKQMMEIGLRCTEARKLAHEKEDTLKKVQKQLEGMRKENDSLRAQLTGLERREEESEIHLAERSAKKGNTSAALEPPSRKPFADVSDKDIGSSKRGANSRERRKRSQGVDAGTTLDPALDEDDEEEQDNSGSGKPTPKKGSSKKRAPKRTEATDPTPPAKRKPPMQRAGASRSAKRLPNPGDKGGALLLPAQLLVGSNPSAAPSTGQRRKLGSFSGTLLR